MMFNPGPGYLEAKTQPAELAQATRHQELAAKTAERLGEPKKTAAYIRIFMENGVVEDKIEECIQWVLSRPFKVRNPAALFMSQYQKFIQSKPFPPHQ